MRMLILSTALVLSGCSPSPDTTPYDWQLRDGFPKPQVPEDNPMTAAKVELGRHLFYDKRLSGNKQQSCASCHIQSNGFAEPLDVSIGSTGQVHRRNSLALINIAYNKTLTWAHDELTSIERQLLLPMFGEEPVELGITGHEEEILARLNNTREYQALTTKAFGENELNFDLIVKSLSSFVRSLTSFNSPFDRYAYDMDDSALSTEVLKGMNLFFSEKLECHHCHGGFNFTQSTTHEKQPLDRRPFHNTGLYNIEGVGYPTKDKGLREISLNEQDDGRFRSPTLRNIEVTAPYMHDGSIATLEEVIDFYANGGRNVVAGNMKGDGRQHSYKSQFMKGFDITAEEKQALIAFLKTLTDESFLNDDRFADPWVTNDKNN